MAGLTYWLRDRAAYGAEVAEDALADQLERIRPWSEPAALGCRVCPTSARGESQMKIHYLEIVAADVDGVCAAYESAHGVQFGSADPLLGGARTAPLAGGGSVGVRAPLRDDEDPIVRPYWLVDDIEAALDAVRGQGAAVAHPPLEIPERGTFAIYLQGGVNHGLWQL